MNHCHILNRQIQQYYLTISALRISWFRLGIFLLQPSHPCMCLQSVGKLNFQQERACCAASDVTMWLSLVKQSWCVALIKKLNWDDCTPNDLPLKSTYDTTPEHKTSCTQTCICSSELYCKLFQGFASVNAWLCTYVSARTCACVFSPDSYYKTVKSREKYKPQPSKYFTFDKRSLRLTSSDGMSAGLVWH